MKKSVLFSMSALVAAAAIAQPVVGSLSDVGGLVTITQNNQLVTATNGAGVVDGARIVSMSTGRVTVQVNNCEIELKPNQSVTVDSSLSCDKLKAAVVNNPLPLATAGATAGGDRLALASFGFLAAYMIYRDRSISPR